jgi:hypothetical protein
MAGEFGANAPRVSDYGYDPIPITLPTDPVEDAGKRPAQRGAWQRGCLRANWKSYAHCGLGILTKTCPAVDIDVKDQKLAEDIHGIVDRFLGDAPYRIGQAPKRLLPFRLVGEPFKKRKVAWRGVGDALHTPERPPAVEILADGQQFVAFGVHPDTGRPYEWHRDPDLNIPRALLPPLDRDKAERFIRALAGTLERHGATIVTLSGITAPADVAPPPLPPLHSGPHPAAEFLRKHGLRVAAPPSEAERIGTALDRLPVPDDYQEWIRIGHALKAALPGEDGRRLWHHYSARSTLYNERQAEWKWRSFKPGRITAGSIFWGARA